MRFCGHCGASLSIPGVTYDIDSTQTLALSDGLLSDGTMFAGRYMVIDDLGKGGMGHVYRVLDTKIDEEVALKFINPEIAADAKVIERFRNEMKVTRKITHRNVCRMYDLNEDGQSLFITMEYIPGEDLADMIRRLGRLPLEKAFPIAQQVCEGLDEVHRLGVVHRDLKPKNIMIDREGHAKIMDFGLARTPHGIKLTEVGHVVGTPAFMSPEQVNGESVDPRSDIFSLGIIMFMMLTDKLPFEADTTLTLALLHKSYRPPNPSSLNPHVSRELGQVILKCLEVDREKRYQSAQELLADLKRVSARFDTYAIHVPDKSRTATAAPSSGLSWKKALLAGSLVLALAASGLGVRTFVKRSRLNAARTGVLREIERLAGAKDLSGAFQLARQFEKENPADGRLAALWPLMSSRLSVRTTPPGATVSMLDARAGGKEMQILGQAPLESVRVPLSQVRIRIEKEGYVPLEDTISDAGVGIDCLLVEQAARLADPHRAVVDELITNGNRVSYKINAGLDSGIKAGDQGALLGPQSGGPGEAASVIARFRVKEALRDRSLIETRDQKGEVRLGQIVRFERKPAAVPVTIVTEPNGASLLVDGEPGGLAGNPVFLTPGKHKFLLVKPGYEPFETSIEVGQDPVARSYRMTPKATSPAQGTLAIASEPSDAEVYLGDPPRFAGTTPFEEKVSPGKVQVRVRKEGYQDRVEEIEVSAGKPSSERFTLLPLDGLVTVTSVPAGADIFIDSVPVGKTPLEDLPLRPGTYEIKVVLKGQRERADTITVNPGEAQNLEYALRSSQPARVRYHLRVSSDPPDASVTINGALQAEKTPLVAETDKPEVRLVIEKEGFKRLERDLSLKPPPDRNDLPPFRMEKLGAARLKITSSDAAQVYLDGRPLGTTPPQIDAPTYEGTHTVKWVVEGMDPWEQTVTLGPNDVKALHFNKEAHPDLFRGGRYELGASPKAVVEVDGKSLGSAPPDAALPCREGPHAIKYTFRDASGKALVVVEIDDRLESGSTKRIRVSAEAAGLKSSGDPEFPPDGLDPAREHGLIVRARPGSTLDNLTLQLDGKGLETDSAAGPRMLCVPRRDPHALKLDLGKAGKSSDLEVKLFCPDIDRRLVIHFSMMVR